MADMLTDLYGTYLEEMGGDFDDPGTHAYEWENYIKPNSPSTDMYHQMAMYNMLDKKLPDNKLLRLLGGISSIPITPIASLFHDPFQAYLDHGIDKGSKGPLTSYIADQNPFPQAWNRMKGAGEFVRNELGLGRRDDFNQAYNQAVETPRNMERTLSRFNPDTGQVKAFGLNEGGIASLNRGGNPHAWNPHQEPKIPLLDDLRDQMYDWILQQMMREREKEMFEQQERDKNPMLYPPEQLGGMEV